MGKCDFCNRDTVKVDDKIIDTCLNAKNTLFKDRCSLLVDEVAGQPP